MARQANKDERVQTAENNDTLLLEGGKFCLDVAKLVFAGVILAGIMKENADAAILYTIGIVVVAFFVIFGFYLIKHSKRKRR
ncbi:MAG: ABC transporter permease [Bacteroidaceae bacterium]|nr:ABC transporter permease [Bacteroidaceae bacterium]